MGQPSQGVDLKTMAATAAEIERLSAELARAQSALADQTLKIKTDADTRIEAARIEAASRERVAEIQAASSERLHRIEATLQPNEKPAVQSMADSAPSP